MAGSGDGERERERMLNLEREGSDKELLCSGFSCFSKVVSCTAGGGASQRAMTDADSFISVSPIL